jgi:alcohol dehydrogenase class IV
MSQQFNVPSTVIIGGGASGELAAQIKRLNADRVLVVTDQGMIELGVVDKVIGPLEGQAIHASIFADVQPDPTDRNVLAALAQFRESSAQAIVALGGGSPIDCAKVVSILAANALPMSQYLGYHKITRAGAPLIAIPTTAGTGSEVTKVAVITDTERDVKMMMLDVHLLPRAALVDYTLTMSMPAALTAAVGVDTLTHAIEAYVSRKANPMTDPLALSCMRLVAEHLRTAFREPNNPAAREGMMLAACQGGMAFANSSVCLVHGMSRPIGALFHLPHGLSNAVLLPTVTRFSILGATSRYATVARTLGLASDTDSDLSASTALVAGLEQLNRDLNVPRLGECRGVEQRRFEHFVPKMASDALTSGSPQNNPRVPTVEEIVALYRDAW